ncbi:MAG: helix-turn-helix domain-containing protein [Sphingosinicella sp.]|uniref:helix-turn-helix domain-containing protein n=1 Tax=Sphingosinicella sp. TaxID=1917971 RepID=UPI004037E68B
MPIRRRITDPKGFARRVAKRREEKGLTLAELGRAAGVSGTCVWNWENGNTFPKAPALRALAAALGATATYLVEGPDEPVLVAAESSPDAPSTSLPRGGVPIPPDKNGLSISEAKEGLSRYFGVPVESVQITISG